MSVESSMPSAFQAAAGRLTDEVAPIGRTGRGLCPTCGTPIDGIEASSPNTYRVAACGHELSVDIDVETVSA